MTHPTEYFVPVNLEQGGFCTTVGGNSLPQCQLECSGKCMTVAVGVISARQTSLCFAYKTCFFLQSTPV